MKMLKLRVTEIEIMREKKRLRLSVKEISRNMSAITKSKLLHKLVRLLSLTLIVELLVILISEPLSLLQLHLAKTEWSLLNLIKMLMLHLIKALSPTTTLKANLSKN